MANEEAATRRRSASASDQVSTLFSFIFFRRQYHIRVYNFVPFTSAITNFSMGIALVKEIYLHMNFMYLPSDPK